MIVIFVHIIYSRMLAFRLALFRLIEVKDAPKMLKGRILGG